MKRKILVVALALMLVFSLAACGGGSAGGGGGGGNVVDDNYGSFENPIYLGDAAMVGDNWKIAITDINPDAWEIIQEHNAFMTELEDDLVMVLATLDMTYLGEDSKGIPWLEFETTFLGSDGEVYETDYSFLPNALVEIEDMDPGERLSGEVCWVMPEDAVEMGIIVIDAFFPIGAGATVYYETD